MVEEGRQGLLQAGHQREEEDSVRGQATARRQGHKTSTTPVRFHHTTLTWTLNPTAGGS